MNPHGRLAELCCSSFLGSMRMVPAEVGVWWLFGQRLKNREKQLKQRWHAKINPPKTKKRSKFETWWGDFQYDFFKGVSFCFRCCAIRLGWVWELVRFVSSLAPPTSPRRSRDVKLYFVWWSGLRWPKRRCNHGWSVWFEGVGWYSLAFGLWKVTLMMFNQRSIEDEGIYKLAMVLNDIVLGITFPICCIAMMFRAVFNACRFDKVVRPLQVQWMAAVSSAQQLINGK